MLRPHRQVRYRRPQHAGRPGRWVGQKAIHLSCPSGTRRTLRRIGLRPFLIRPKNGTFGPLLIRDLFQPGGRHATPAVL
jgi:hypothetical protein